MQPYALPGCCHPTRDFDASLAARETLIPRPLVHVPVGGELQNAVVELLSSADHQVDGEGAPKVQSMLEKFAR